MSIEHCALNIFPALSSSGTETTNRYDLSDYSYCTRTDF
jgi:hypothetical protein